MAGPDVELTFMLSVFVELRKRNKASQYFFRDSDKVEGQCDQENWWDRVSQIVGGDIEWPPKKRVRADKWARLNLSPKQDFKDGIRRMKKALSTYRSGKRKEIAQKNAGVVKKNNKRQRKSPPGDGRCSRSTHSPRKKQSSVPTSSLTRENTPFQIQQPEEPSASSKSCAGELPAAQSPAQPTIVRKFVYGQSSSLNINDLNQYNLVSGEDKTRSEDVIRWESPTGQVVITRYPVLLNDGGKNKFWKAGRFLANLASLGIAAEECDDLTTISRGGQSETDIIQSAMPSLAVGRPVIVWGPRDKDSWRNGVSKLRGSGTIEKRRICEVFDFEANEEKAIRGSPPDPTVDDAKYEKILDTSVTTRNDDAWYLPQLTNPDSDDDLRENITFAALMERLEDGNSTNYALDVPSSGHTGITYGALDDLDRAINNSKVFKTEAVAWPDKIWGLVHGSPVISWWHHDSDGKMTVVNAESGAKIWSVFLPNPELTEQEVRDVQLWLSQSKDKLPKDRFGKVVNLFLLPGDTLIMPPGLLHLVYTPVPSVFSGSSFWNYQTLHLTGASLRADSQLAEYLTNVDHDYALIFRSLVRLALSTAIVERFVTHRAVVYSLYDMLVNFRDYTYVSKHDQDYKDKKTQFSTKRRKGKGGAVVPANERQLIEEVKRDRVKMMKDTLWLEPAISLLEEIIRAGGETVDNREGERGPDSKRRLQRLAMTSSWRSPGAVIEIDRDALLNHLMGFV
ncbi:hypothetical protein PM082_000445 [Marasmius tenuissimus]|nr:hypothetical protein PM082_000445 [Marasmius tenuissimus]